MRNVFMIVAGQLVVTIIIVSIVVAAAQSNTKEKPSALHEFF